MAEEREDFLTEDADLPGQKFCLLSFLSPEKVLVNKDHFMFERFLETYELDTRVTSMEKYLVKTFTDINKKLDVEADKLEEKDLSGAAAVCRQSRIRIDTIMDEFHGFVKSNQKELTLSKIKELYDDFIYKNKQKLEDDFYAKNDFRTTVRGLKIRGVYSSQVEAVARSKKLQRLDTLHNIFVGEVGKWLPWDPAPHEVSDQEYAEDQLNTLMKKYKENEEARDTFEKEQRQKTMAGSKKKVAEVAEGAEVADAPPTAAASFSEMFNNDGPADLAIARKMGQPE
jgi:hypothetical protein